MSQRYKVSPSLRNLNLLQVLLHCARSPTGPIVGQHGIPKGPRADVKLPPKEQHRRRCRPRPHIVLYRYSCRFGSVPLSSPIAQVRFPNRMVFLYQQELDNTQISGNVVRRGLMQTANRTSAPYKKTQLKVH